MSASYPIVRLNINNQTIEFRNTDIIQAEVVQEIHPVGIELPASSATIRIYTDDPRFNPFSDGELYAELVDNLIVDVYEMLDGVELYVGRFYLNEWRNTNEHEFEFVCQDAIGVLGSLSFDGMFWENSVSLETAVATVLDPTGMPYTVDANIASRQVKGYLPAGTVREALQQVLFAGRAIAVTSQSDKIVVRDGTLPLDYARYGEVIYGQQNYNGVIYVNDGTITDAEKTDKQQLKIEPLVTEIKLIAHDYSKGTVLEEIYPSTWLEPGEYKLVYQKPYYGVIAEGAGATPAYLMNEAMTAAIATEDDRIIGFEGAFDYGVNYIMLHVVEAGNVIVKGYEWIDSKREFSHSGDESQKSNVWKIENATLISSDLAPLALEKLVTFAEMRYKHEITMFPRADIQTGKSEIVDTLYGKQIGGVIKRVVSDLTGGFLMDIELLGVERSS